MMRDVVAVVGDTVEAFELGVVAEVFGIDRSDDGLPTFDFAVAAVAGPGMLATSSGFSLVVEHGLERVARADVVVVPAWRTTTPAPEALLRALRDAVGRGATVLSVCSGAFPVAEAGLLDGRRATTHWKYATTFASRFPAVEVDPDVLYVDEGRVITSAGTAAGIDACLHLLRRELGAHVANGVARRMVVPPHREGGQAQYVETPVRVAEHGADVAAVLDDLRSRLHEPLTVAQMASTVHMSARTFARWFRATVGTTPHRWLLDQRLALAERLLETTDAGVEQIAHRTGLGSADSLRHHLTARRGVPPTTYRRTFRGTGTPADAGAGIPADAGSGPADAKTLADDGAGMPTRTTTSPAAAGA